MGYVGPLVMALGTFWGGEAEPLELIFGTNLYANQVYSQGNTEGVLFIMTFPCNSFAIAPISVPIPLRVDIPPYIMSSP